MSSASVLNTMFGYDASSAETHRREEESTRDPLIWNVQRFGEEQVRSLVRQVFFSGGPKTPRQVVFSGVDQSANVGEICLQVGRTLCTQTAGSVCIVDVNFHPPEAAEGEQPAPGREHQKFDCLRNSALMLSKKLWLVPFDIFLRDEKALSAAWLRGRIDELRLDFDYTIFQAPPAGRCGDASLLGHLCDGVVLVLTANSTRRIAARKVKDRLYSANARLLGTVLSDRRFPIPEGIYRRL
jgi:hypothetical protein